MAEQVSFKDLLGTGAHFGHVTRKWHPNYEPFILMERNGVHIINLEETVKHLNTAIDFVKKIVEKNGEILFVGTKKQAKDIVQQEADRCGMFYIVERWLGGTLTNFSTIKKSIKRLKALEKEGSSIYENLTKKEVQMLNRERLKLSDQHRGIKDMRRLPDAVVIVDVDREITALLEAIKLEIPVIAMVDTNCDPRIVTYPIPANDDSVRAIQIIISALVDTILEVKDQNATKEEDIAEVIEKAETIVAKPEKTSQGAEENNAEVKVVKISESNKKIDEPAQDDEKAKKVKTVETVKVEKKTEKKSTTKTKPKAETKKSAVKVATKTKTASKKSTTAKTTKKKTTVKKATVKKTVKEAEKK
ncbi:MAG: 30S ribosomal protein S2 [Planctomycetia bacterium]|nr:30S ribosomal protein S2 [Planctomycetia bacterium]